MADKPDPSPDFSRKEVLKKRTDLCMNLLENRRASFERWPLTSSGLPLYTREDGGSRFLLLRYKGGTRPCALLQELTVKDVLDLEKERAKNRARLLAEMYYAELDDAKRKVMEELDKLQHKKQ
ncbi:hypothetical protein MRX96_016815 [Rhipicephalus microplus]